MPLLQKVSYLFMHQPTVSLKNFCRLAFSILLVTQIAACSSTKHSSQRLPGAFQISPITIDGFNNDWPSPYPEYDDKAMLGYAVTNDKENLYISVETGDPATQLKILRNGLTVWIDKTGGKEEVTAVNFPLPDQYKTNKVGGDEPERPAKGQWQQSPQQGSNRLDQKRMELEDRVVRALDKAKEFSLQGFKGCNQQFSILEKDSCGIVTRINIDSTNEMVWEVVVPFRAFYGKNEITRADKGKPMSITIETEGSKRPAGQGGGNGGHAGGGGIRPSIGFGGMGGMGMGMGGGSHGGNRSGAQNASNAMMESLYKSTKTVKKFGIGWKD